jgi:hypothetical protein
MGRGSGDVATTTSSNDDETVANGRSNVDQRWAALRTQMIGCIEARHRQTKLRRTARRDGWARARGPGDVHKASASCGGCWRRRAAATTNAGGAGRTARCGGVDARVKISGEVAERRNGGR